MPKVEASIEISASLPKVYKLSKAIERFPEFMPDVQAVKILSKEGNKIVSHWEGNIAELRRVIRWTEEDLWDDENHICYFKQIEGDFHKYEGEWKFVRISEGRTKLELIVEFEYNVPLIGTLIKNLLKSLVRKNMERMLQAIKIEAEKEL